MKTKKTESLSIRLDPDVREAIKRLAQEDDRSLSAYINRALRQHVEDRQAVCSTKPKIKSRA